MYLLPAVTHALGQIHPQPESGQPRFLKTYVEHGKNNWPNQETIRTPK